jgi:hypothetical protein
MNRKQVYQLIKMALDNRELLLDSFEEDFLALANKKFGKEVIQTELTDVELKIIGEIEYIKANKLDSDAIRKRYTKAINMDISRQLGIDFDQSEKEIEITDKIYEKLKELF